MEDPAMIRELNAYDQFFDPKETHAYLRGELDCMDQDQAEENRFAEDLDVKYEYAVKRALAEGAECGKNEATEQNALTFIKAGFSKDKIFKILNMSEEKIAAFLNKYKDL